MKPFIWIQCVMFIVVGTNFLGRYPGNTPCKVRAYYTFKNTRSENVLVNLIDSSRAWASLIPTVRIWHDSLMAPQNSCQTDTVDFEFNGTHGCRITNETKNTVRVLANFFVNDSMFESRFIFPFDTTQTGVSVCVDCIQIFDDTIVIK